MNKRCHRVMRKRHVFFFIFTNKTKLKNNYELA